MNVSVVGLVLALGMASCSNNARWKPDVTVRNNSTNHLDWVRVNWGGDWVSVGVMSPGNGATLQNHGFPTGVNTHLATIEFINEDMAGLNWESGSNEEVRARRANSWTRVPVDVSQLLQLGPEYYRVTFRILSLTNADVLIERKERR